MKFYRENNINPAASCLPLLAQFPVFIALYLVLRHFADHPPPGNLEWLGLWNITEHASVGWGPVLLVVYVASQLLSTVLMSTTMDKSQRIILLVLPLTFVFFLINFPTGLVIYWVTTNLWTVGQGLITRRLMPKPAQPSRRTSRTPPREESTQDGAPDRTPVPAPAAAP